MLFLPSKACISFAVKNNYGIWEQLQAKKTKNWKKRAFLDKKPVGFTPIGKWDSMESTGWKLWASPLLRKQSHSEAAVEEELQSWAKKPAAAVEPWISGVSEPPFWSQGVKPQQPRSGCCPHLSWRWSQGRLWVQEWGFPAWTWARLERLWPQLTECLRALSQPEHVNPIPKCTSALTVLFNQVEMTYQKMGDDCG